MFAPEKILCPIDFSQLSGLALKYAFTAASAYHAELTVLHAQLFEIPRYFSAKEDRRLIEELKSAAATLQKELEVYVKKTLGTLSDSVVIHYKVIDRHPLEAILNTAEKDAHDLIIIGTHGLSGLKRLFLGSVAENVVRESKIPVFTIRQNENNFIDINRVDAMPRIKNVLCPCNATESSVAALQVAAAIAGQFDSGLTVLHIPEAKGPHDAMISDTRALGEWASGILGPGFDFKPVIRQGLAAKEIIGQANDSGTDMIIFSASHNGFLNDSFFGRTTELVLRQSPAPVLVVPHFQA